MTVNKTGQKEPVVTVIQVAVDRILRVRPDLADVSTLDYYIDWIAYLAGMRIYNSPPSQ